MARRTRRDGDEGHLVYSTEGGRVTPPASPAPGPAGDGIVRVGRTSSGRRGKTVTLVTGLPEPDLASIAAQLKRLCGSGGSVKDGVVEVQGDHRAKVIAHLEGRYRVKPTGG